LLEGDARYWFEKGGVRDLVIRINIFDNGNYGVWCNGIIEAAAHMDPDYLPTSRYNKNLLVEQNLFRVFDGTPILYLECVEGVVFRENTIEKTTAYPDARPSAEQHLIRNCSGVQLEG